MNSGVIIGIVMIIVYVCVNVYIHNDNKKV